MEKELQMGPVTKVQILLSDAAGVGRVGVYENLTQELFDEIAAWARKAGESAI